MYRPCYEKAIIPTTRVEYIPYDFSFDKDALLDANSLILRCLKAFNQIKYVEDALSDFKSFKSTVRAPAIESDMTPERKARSFFLEFEIYLDHWKKYISYRGKKDELNPVFDKATHNAFGSSDNYALCGRFTTEEKPQKGKETQ